MLIISSQNTACDSQGRLSQSGIGLGFTLIFPLYLLSFSPFPLFRLYLRKCVGGDGARVRERCGAVVWLFGAPGRHRAWARERESPAPAAIHSVANYTAPPPLTPVAMAGGRGSVLFCSGTVAMAAAICRRLLLLSPSPLTYPVSERLGRACTRL